MHSQFYILLYSCNLKQNSKIVELGTRFKKEMIYSNECQKFMVYNATELAPKVLQCQNE